MLQNISNPLHNKDNQVYNHTYITQRDTKSICESKILPETAHRSPATPESYLVPHYKHLVTLPSFLGVCSILHVAFDWFLKTLLIHSYVLYILMEARQLTSLLSLFRKHLLKKIPWLLFSK